MSLLGVDVGTTGTKAVAFNLEGEAIASAYREYPLLSPRPGWLELDARKVGKAVLDVVREVASKTKHDPIRALSVSCQGEATVPVSRVVPSGTAVGEVPRKRAEELGLPEGVLAVTGGHDQPCNALGSGAVREEVAA